MSEFKEPEESYKFFKYVNPQPGEEVVISGIAGRFPKSNNLHELKDNIFNRKDCITDYTGEIEHSEIPRRIGKINNIEKFDALFFDVNFKQAHTMDPMGRMLFEHTYEAIVDAGIHPKDLHGTRTGVFIGSCFSDTEKIWYYDKLRINGLGIIGCNKASLANRISHWLGVTGPSYNIDTACSSSLFAMEHAYRAIRSGQCDYAIVGGSNLCLHPYISLQFKRLGVLSQDGCCKCFDEDATGYTRSDTVGVAFLQKAKNTKRIYATVIHTKTNCDGYKEQGITYPSSKIQSTLFKEFYEECGVSTACIHYIEAHGTGTKVGDPKEINAIDRIFTKNRNNPLKVGSIKANVGHAEPASGICSIAKAIISMESGLIPPNINLNQPRKDVKAFTEGRVKVVTETTPLDGEYIGVNAFGFGGANAHILLKSNPKTKINKGLPNDDLPRLVVVSGRTKEAVATILNDIDNRPIDIEFIRLLHDIHLKGTSGHLCRGYTISGFKISDENTRAIENYSDIKKPILFVFSGIGSQWPGMGQALMRFTIFAKAIEKCDAVLKRYNLNIYEILTKKDNSIFDNILHSIVGTAAVQIGLVDLLTSVGIIPDYIIGHSVGELGCAYADGCFTAEQMILAAYSQGMALTETKIPHGCMVTVELSYADIKNWCPATIDIACHNGSKSTTISGLAKSVRAFVKKLQTAEIFTEEVWCNNIPYHSRYIAAVEQKLFAYLKEVIPTAKPRSKKWLSTSIPRNEWSTSTAKLSSAEYHTNNLLKTVLFEETLTLIPDNAVAIEIAPQSLLEAVLKTSLQSTITIIPLTHRDHEDNVEVFLRGLGKLYNTGSQLDLVKLYPPVEYPVSRGTPMISPLIRWKHSDNWFVAPYKMVEKIASGERTIEISIANEYFEYIKGHVIDGRNLFPATGYLCLVWQTLGMMIGQLYMEISVIIENVKFNRATTIPKDGTVEMTVMIQKGTGNFEIAEKGVAVVTGMIRVATNLLKEKIPLDVIKANINNEEEVLNTKDIYKELKLRGYEYNGLFRNLHSASVSGKKGHVEWKKNWAAFIDNILQMKILAFDTRSLLVPIGIRKLIIDINAHQRYLESLTNNEQYVPVQLLENIDAIIAGGVEIHNIRANEIARKKPVSDPIIEEYKFIAYRDRKEMSLREILTLSMHITLENIPMTMVKTIELVEYNDNISAEKLVSPLLEDILANLPLIQANVNIFASPNTFDEKDIPKNNKILELKNIQTDNVALLAVGCSLLTDKKKDSLKQLLESTRDGAFLLSREKNISLDFSILKEFQLGIVLEKRTSEESWILLRKIKNTPKNTSFIYVNSNEFNWLQEVQTVLTSESKKDDTRVILVEEGNFESGLLGFINCLQKEPGGKIFRAVLIQDIEAPKFSLELPLYSEQFETDLVINVLRSGNVWGSYRHQLLPPHEPKPTYHALVNQLTRGNLSSIRWVEGPITKDYQKEDLVRIHYASLNFKDVMITTGKIEVDIFQDDRKQLDCTIGFEYSGISISGRRVMGLNSNRCISNFCQMDDIFSWTIPEGWSMEDAATTPCVYSTCTAALYINAEMKKGDKVLIHAGAGGVGQAAITLALHEGCEVFTTVGTPEKRKFIREKFPSIDDNHIGNSRDTSFEQMILQQTNGAGVDIVLNSLAEEKLLASLRCLAYKGRFVEIGKFDLASNNPLDTDIFTKEISFHAVMLDKLMTTNDKIKDEIHSRVNILLKKNVIKPIVRTVFSKDQVETAFRYMAAGKHIGKVLIKIREENETQNTPILAKPSYRCFPNKSYIVIGGLGGFGLELIDWLVLRNAQNIVITSRNGLKNGYQQMRIKRWESYGVNIKILVGLDASKREDCEVIVKSAIDGGPVDGIFNLAVSLKDGICRNQTIQTFEESFKGKAWATKRLDEVTRKLCPDLRHFVVFSSVSCGRGNAGQTNYGMANSVMERICEKRIEEGLSGLAIQWGVIGDVGLVADMQNNDKDLVIGGTLQQKITSCLEELNRFLVQDKPIVASMIVAEKRSSSDSVDNIVDTVLKIMCIKDLKTISQHISLAELGMDSMMGIEIKQTLEREYEIYLNAEDIRSLNFAKLLEMENKRTADDIDHNKIATKKILTGIKMLMQSFGEKLSLEISVPLKTNPQKGRSEVFFIPGIEGYGNIFKTLESKIKSPAICFQLGTNYDLNTIEEMANLFLPHMLEKLKDRIDFTLVGYSFGSLVAIELMRQLEAYGFNGQLILIDGAPQLMKELINQQLLSSSVEELQNNVLVSIMNAFTSINSEQFAFELRKYKTWDEKLNAFFNAFSPEYKQLYLERDQRKAIFSFYVRLQACMKYDPKPMPYLRTPITLFKPVLSSVQQITYDYGLQNITEGKVEVHVVNGDHVTILENIKIAMAINREPFKEDL
ncbi:fatty acid synthase-like [Vespula maculifrons]|uniref:Fatty acid synthase-like n=1 Tax=Vespula maculifrons TaxID=7453 RepID=A0ABD2B996_VESMC